MNIFISLPYSDNDPAIRAMRARHCTNYALEMIKQGHQVISPVLMSHPLYEQSLIDNYDILYDYWLDMTELYLRLADEIHVIKLEGWMNSKGVKFELDYAQRHNIPVVKIHSAWKYGMPTFLEKLKTGDKTIVQFYTSYVLWECSTTFITDNGLPDNEQVARWIEVLSARTDDDFSVAINECKKYIGV